MFGHKVQHVLAGIGADKAANQQADQQRNIRAKRKSQESECDNLKAMLYRHQGGMGGDDGLTLVRCGGGEWRHQWAGRAHETWSQTPRPIQPRKMSFYPAQTRAISGPMSRTTQSHQARFCSTWVGSDTTTRPPIKAPMIVPSINAGTTWVRISERMINARPAFETQLHNAVQRDQHRRRQQRRHRCHHQQATTEPERSCDEASNE